jgi:phage terminase large subunit
MTPAEIAAATYAAMLTLPAYAELGRALTDTTDDETRLALLDAADDFTRRKALEYIAASRDPVLRERARRLAWMRQDPQRIAWLKKYYADPKHTADFIADWCCTVDPRNIERGLPAMVPFTLFPRQRELVDWIIARWKGSEGGIVVKPRDCGASWTILALACTLCLFNRDLVVGFGSRKEEYVDKLGAPKALFSKARTLMSNLPAEFVGEWSTAKHAPLMRIMFPDTGSALTGESGDKIGRGDRTSLYFIDESAHLEHPELVDQAFAGAVTNCRIDVSTPNGMSGTGAPFYLKSINPDIKKFEISWRDDLRKDDAWLEKQKRELARYIVLQEIMCDFTANVSGGIFDSLKLDACVGLAEALEAAGYTGVRNGSGYGGFDVADTGRDMCSFAARRGNVLEHVEEWSGIGSTIVESTHNACRIAEEHSIYRWSYDATGVGAAVNGIVSTRNKTRVKKHAVDKWSAGGAVKHPERNVPGAGDRKNKDHFYNLVAQTGLQARHDGRGRLRGASIVERWPACAAQAPRLVFDGQPGHEKPA